MDGSAAIEVNREALKRIVATLTDMAGGEDADADGSTSPLWGGRREASGGGRDGKENPTRRPDDRRPPRPEPAEGGEFEREQRTTADAAQDPHSDLLRKPPLPLKGGEEERPSSPPPLPLPPRSGERWSAKPSGVGVEFTRAAPSCKSEIGRESRIPRLLWRAILALLRPAEPAARRLIIAASRGLTVPPPRPRKPKPVTMEPLLRRFGIAVMIAPANAARPPTLPRLRGRGTAEGGGGGAAEPAEPRIPTFPLFDPPRRLALYGQRRHTVPPHAAPRIFVPGITEPSILPPPPAPDDLISAERLTRRLAALSAALDDLPGQARRFAKWQASRAAAARDASRDPAAPRRVSPLRLGRPPGGRLSRYDPTALNPPNIREVDEILAHTHSLALYALDYPDTS